MNMRTILLVLALAAPGLAGGEVTDPLERIARLSYVKAATFSSGSRPGVKRSNCRSKS